jgi:hypothetical protein
MKCIQIFESFYLAMFVETFQFLLQSTIHSGKVKVKLTLE